MTAGSRNSWFFEDTPPKPVLTLRVGVVGHRPKDGRYTAASETFVTKRLRAVFRKIDARLASLWEQQRQLGKEGTDAKDKKNYYDIETSPKVRLVTGLAEGADQWAVNATKPDPAELEETPDAKPLIARWAVDAVLPFPLGSYLRDFKKSAASDADVTGIFNRYLEDPSLTCVELPEEPAPREVGLSADEIKAINKRRRDAGYGRAGTFLLGQVDLLVAVWDGRPGDGPGGTAALVQGALDAELPVFWIHSLHDAFVRKIEAIDDDGQVDAPSADCLDSTLEAVVDAIVLLPANLEEGGVDFAKRLSDFLKETPPRILPIRWLVYDNFKRWRECKPPRRELSPQTKPEYERWWGGLNADLPEAGPLQKTLDDILLPRYAWADALALEYSHGYRSTYFICYVLAAFAVLVALSSLVIPEHDGLEGKLAFKALLVTIELLTIGGIIGLLREGHLRRWHERWLEYRSLAELLLNVRFLAYFGEHGRAHKLGRIEADSSAWFLWYLRATIREIGVPRACFDGAYQWKLLNSVKEQVIRDQRNWHRRNARALRRMHHCLHSAGNFCFYGTFFVLGAFFLAWASFVSGMLLSQCLDSSELMFFGKVVPELTAERCPVAAPWIELRGLLYESREWLVLIAALFPAAGAAFASIRETGDFEKVAKQSSTTSDKLFDLHRDFVRGQNRLKFEYTDELLRRAAQALSEDLSAWQSVYGHKRLELPA